VGLFGDAITFSVIVNHFRSLTHQASPLLVCFISCTPTGGHEPSAALFEPDSDHVLMDSVGKMVTPLMPEGARR